MAVTLELFDGSATINFVGSTNYKAAISSVGFGAPETNTVLAGLLVRNVTRGPRELSFNLRIAGSSVSDLQSKVRDLENMVAVAEARQVANEGTIVVLKTQLGDTNANDVEWRVLTGALDVPSTVFNTILVDSHNEVVDARLTLLLEPFGRLAQVSPSADTLENEQDSTLLNYMDLTSITGTHGAKLQLKVHDPATTAWSGSKKIWIAKRSGSRRTDTLFFQDVSTANPFNSGARGPASASEFSSNGALSLAAASGGQVADFRWTKLVSSAGTTIDWIDCGNAQYAITGGNIPNGLYRVLVRATVDWTVSGITVGDFGFALGWSFGGKSKTPVEGDDIKATLDNTYEIFDLGELALPPVNVPDGFTAPTFNLRVHGTYHDSATSNSFGVGEYVAWKIDYIFLFPLDEGAAIIDSVGTSDRMLIDSLSDTPGVYLLNSSDVVQQFAVATGGPFDIGPEDTRIYWLRDDVGNPSNIQAVLTPKYTPLVMDI